MSEVAIMKNKLGPSWIDHLARVYWAIVGLVGLGQPIVDRRSMYGDDPRNDPYNIEFDPSSNPGR
jgi:hypothetical protein